MELLEKVLRNIGKIFVLCLSAGFIVSKIEKKKGWVAGHQPGWYEKNIKRALDFGLSLFALFFLWPVLLITGVAIKIKLGSPVLFRQKRPGLGGKIFIITKYRTMLNICKDNGELLSDEERMTDFGRRLRSMSLDELPELFNIINGDMSIIGPRPLLVEYLPLYNVRQAHRHDVRPGLTGLAQVKGRNALSWDEKFKEDVRYVENITFLGDLRILIDTIKIVVWKRGISSNTSITMEVYKGSEEK